MVEESWSVDISRRRSGSLLRWNEPRDSLSALLVAVLTSRSGNRGRDLSTSETPDCEGVGLLHEDLGDVLDSGYGRLYEGCLDEAVVCFERFGEADAGIDVYLSSRE